MVHTHTFYANHDGFGLWRDVVNDEGATIHLQGAGVYGVTASRGKAAQTKARYLSDTCPDADDKNNITSTSYRQPSSPLFHQLRMVAGSTDADGDATAIVTPRRCQQQRRVRHDGALNLAAPPLTSMRTSLTADAFATGQADERSGWRRQRRRRHHRHQRRESNTGRRDYAAFRSDSSSYIINK